MTKMSKAQRYAILEAHATWNPAHPVDTRGLVQAYERTHRVLKRNGWTRGVRVTTAGLVAAGVDMDAIHAEALTENFRRRVAATRQNPDLARDTLGGVEMFVAVLPILVDQDHAEALEFIAREQHIAQSGVAHIRKNCPAIKVGGCMKCTAPATVRAARGDHSPYAPSGPQTD